MKPEDNVYVSEYAEVRGERRNTLRERVRGTMLDLMATASKVRNNWDDCLSIPRVQFLYIHHVFSDEEGKLRQLLRRLSEKHEFISYSEACDRVLTGNIDRAYIAFSSDDGLKNNLRAGKIFQEFGASACFFVCPGIIGEKDFEKIKRFSSSRLHFPPVEFLNWDDIAELQDMGQEIGSHTMNHINVAGTGRVELLHEIGESFNILKLKCGELKHFAFPYGRYFHFNDIGRRIVFDTGYYSCASAERGCHVSHLDGCILKSDLLVRRDHVILDWPLNHILYFIVRNALVTAFQKNAFPLYEDRNTD